MVFLSLLYSPTAYFSIQSVLDFKMDLRSYHSSAQNPSQGLSISGRGKARGLAMINQPKLIWCPTPRLPSSSAFLSLTHSLQLLWSSCYSQICKLLGLTLAVQWLRLHASSAGAVGLIPGQRTKISHVAVDGQKKTQKTNKKLVNAYLRVSEFS